MLRRLRACAGMRIFRAAKMPAAALDTRVRCMRAIFAHEKRGIATRERRWWRRVVSFLARQRNAPSLRVFQRASCS